MSRTELTEFGPERDLEMQGDICHNCHAELGNRWYVTGDRTACSLDCVAELGGGCPTIYIHE